MSWYSRVRKWHASEKRLGPLTRTHFGPSRIGVGLDLSVVHEVGQGLHQGLRVKGLLPARDVLVHEMTNDGCDRAQLSAMGKEAKAVLEVETLEAVADRGYWDSEEILACDQAGVTVTLPKPMASGSKADGRFGKQDFVHLPDEDAYRCPAGEKLRYYYSNVESGLTLRRYWTTACHTCPLKSRCTTAKERRIVRWEHEDVLEAVQRRLDLNPGQCASGARCSSIPLARSSCAWALPTS